MTKEISVNLVFRTKDGYSVSADNLRELLDDFAEQNGLQFEGDIDPVKRKAKVVIKENKAGEWCASYRAGSRSVWTTQASGVAKKSTIKQAMKHLRKPFKVVEEVETSNIVG